MILSVALGSKWLPPNLYLRGALLSNTLDITFLVPGLQFNGDALTSQSLGGSETAGLCMAREMAARGHNVYMFCNTSSPGQIFDGVTYMPADDWEKFASSTIHDISIVQRLPAMFKQRFLSKLNVLWCHDLALARQYQEIRGVMWNIDGIFVLSEYMKEQYNKVYDIPEKCLWLTRNGINLDLFPAAAVKDRKKLIYSARPERGLDVLLDKIVPRLFQDPDYSLTIYGYDNPTDQFAEFYGKIADKCRPWGDRIMFGGHLNKPDLYKKYTEGGVYVYPTPSPVMPKFAEISCISAMEVQAAGLPIVTSNVGALRETIANGAGYVVDGDPTDDDYVDRFCKAVEFLVNDDAAYNKASKAGMEHAKDLSWAKVAEQWENKFWESIDDNNDSPVRLARHFIRRSDIYAAEKVVAKNPDVEGMVEVKGYIDKHYSWRHKDVDIVAHYAKGGEETNDRLNEREDPKELFENTDEQRFHYFESILANNPEVNKVLDYGCGHGWCDIYLHNKTGKKVVGVDIDPNAVKWSRDYADKYAKDPNSLAFYNGSLPNDVLIRRLKSEAPFDCLIISEVLEHVREPVELMNSLLPLVKVGGIVIITTPYGPSEYGSFNWQSFRNHMWEFDPHDLHEMFGSQDQFDLSAMSEKINTHTGEVVGFHATTFLRSNKQVKSINWDRKLRLQRPTQTVSVAVMAGGAFVEETMHWMLRSVTGIANEIVIADCGMTEEALRIVSQYPVKLVPGVNPLKEGFEKGRNASLDACSMDWALWIDCDERLVDSHNMTKYLRKGMYDGFSIKQHHFTIDAGFKPDMPTRLFRRVIEGPDQIKFYGYIHEHPEKTLNGGVGEVIIVADSHIAHVGYLSESGRRQRFWRNHPLLAKDMEAYPDRSLQKHFIMRDNMLKCSFGLQNNGGQVTEDMKILAEETKNIFRENFLGKPSYLNSDSLLYYSQALEILGEGVEVGFDISANKNGVGDQMNGAGTRARFASYEEAQKEISWRLKDKLDPFMKEWW